jgi:hypothetical protein
LKIKTFFLPIRTDNMGTDISVNLYMMASFHKS